jgi:hypothetical protein
VKLGRRWQDYVATGRWQLNADAFWTYPHCFHRMRAVDPGLYSTLATARLVIFKGDLNYRKLVGDLNWEATVPFRTALQVGRHTHSLHVNIKQAFTSLCRCRHCYTSRYIK